MSDTTTLTLIIGSYPAGRETAVPGQGLAFARFDPDTATVTPQGGWHAPAASFSALSPAGDRLYAVREEAEGQVTAFELGQDRLRHLSTLPTGGEDPCHLAVDPSGRYLLTANYSSGSVAVHPILPDGALAERTDLVTHVGSGPVADRQAGPHAHMILPDPTGETLLAVDLGADSIYAYTLEADTGRLTLRAANRMRPGSGPRHLVFSRDGAFAYLVNELDSTVSVLSYDRGSGKIEELSVRPAAPSTPEQPNYPGGIALSPDGRHVYVSNRGEESIAVFAVSEDGGDLAPAGNWPCGGSWPRHLTLTPDGRALFCANQRSGTVTVFRVDPADGSLTATGQALEVDQPAHVLVLG
ncbi:MAG TPA: lactonase family protein [Actinocrinis sp.]|nr:lactonase family protein [Actinocrinis sp.]